MPMGLSISLSMNKSRWSKRAEPTILKTTSGVNEYRAGIVASVAMDGAAPELRQEGALREERHLHGAAYIDNPPMLLRVTRRQKTNSASHATPPLHRQ